MNTTINDFAHASVEQLSARIMITDNDLNIVYTNPAVVAFLTDKESEIRGYLPNFSVSKLVGTNIDDLHKNPSHQRSMLSKLSEPYMTSIRFGNTVFSLRATPLYGAGGERIGSQVEWLSTNAFETKATIEALDRSQACIHFEPDGTILHANDLFLGAMGYTLHEVVGQHHRIFMAPEDAAKPEYKALWERLGRGEFFSGVFRRVAKSGKEVWIQASYNPISDAKGTPYKVVKYASDITDMIQASQVAKDTSESVAAAIEEMSASVAEISKNMALSKEAADGIMGAADTSTQASSQLGEATTAMESVVELINSIAGKVNLLALNATIEPARAGEAGRGFAVVAAEVKNLASQTAKATEDIAQKIREVQSVSSDVETSIKIIMDSATQVNQYVTGVASAIEEQTSVNQEISSNTQRLSNSVVEMAEKLRQNS